MAWIYVAGILVTGCFFVDGWRYYLLLTFSVILMFFSDHQYIKMRKQVDNLTEELGEAKIDIHNLNMLYGKLEASSNEGAYGKAYISSKTSDESGDKKSAG